MRAVPRARAPPPLPPSRAPKPSPSAAGGFVAPLEIPQLAARGCVREPHAHVHHEQPLLLIYRAACVAAGPEYAAPNLDRVTRLLRRLGSATKFLPMVGPGVKSRFDEWPALRRGQSSYNFKFKARRKARQQERSANNALRGSTVWSACMVWALETIESRYRKGAQHYPHQQLPSRLPTSRRPCNSGWLTHRSVGLPLPRRLLGAHPQANGGEC